MKKKYNREKALNPEQEDVMPEANQNQEMTEDQRKMLEDEYPTEPGIMSGTDQAPSGSGPEKVADPAAQIQPEVIRERVDTHRIAAAPGHEPVGTSIDIEAARIEPNPSLIANSQPV